MLRFLERFLLVALICLTVAVSANAAADKIAAFVQGPGATGVASVGNPVMAGQQDNSGNSQYAQCDGSKNHLVSENVHFPATAAMADGASNPTVSGIGANSLWFNGSTWDRVYNNEQITAIASTVYNSATTTNSSDLTNFNAKGIVLLFDVTAFTSAGTSTTWNIQAKAGSDYLTVYTFTPTIALGLKATYVYPIASAGSWTVAPIAGIVPRTFRVQVVTVGTPNYTATFTVQEIN